MRHSSTRDNSDRHGNALTRASFVQADDTKLMQEAQVQLFAGEQQAGVEHFMPYGFSHVPQPPSSGGGIRQVAEAIFAFLGGNRSHGVALVVGDRRYRLGNLQPGEVGLHDDQTHQRVIHRGGIYDSAPNGKLHQERIQAAGDTVANELSENLGQVPWLPKTPHSYKHHDASVQQGQHPNTINHQVISGPAQPPGGAGAGLSSIASQLSSIASQISGLVTADVGLPGVNSLAAQANSLASQVPGTPGATPAINNVATQIATLTSSSSITSGGASQLIALTSQLSSLVSGGASQIIHQHSLDQAKGILHAAFEGQHTTTHNQQGVTHTSSVAHTSTAPQINHDGNTNVSDNLHVGDEVLAEGYATASDVRLKTKIANLPSVLDKVLQLKVKSFHIRRVHRDHQGKSSIHPAAARSSFGFISQEVREVFPEAVVGDETREFLAVRESKIGILLLAAFQEHVVASNKVIAELRDEIAALKQQVAGNAL
jgi:hypothetical protein